MNMTMNIGTKMNGKLENIKADANKCVCLIYWKGELGGSNYDSRQNRK